MKFKQNTIVVILLIIIAILLSVMLIPDHEPSSTGAGVVLEPNSSQNQVGNDKVQLPEIAIPGWSAIKLPAGVDEADVSLHNPESNKGFYNLSFTLKIAESGDVIFSTGPIEPGFKCSHVALSKKLEPGEYDAVMFVQPYMQDEQQTPTNNAELEILLIVE